MQSGKSELLFVWDQLLLLHLGSFFFPPPILKAFFIGVEKNILTHLKKPKIQERYNTGFSYHIHANSSLKTVELHWSSDTPMTSTLGNSFNCATLLPDSTQRQGTPPTALGSPTSWGVLPLIYCFFTVLSACLFGFLTAFLFL